MQCPTAILVGPRHEAADEAGATLDRLLATRLADEFHLVRFEMRHGGWEGAVGSALDALRLAGRVLVHGAALVHVQVCGNDRGAPGGDQTDWAGIRSALDEVGYRGPLVIESFTADNAAIAVAASIWRPLAASQDDLARDGLAFLRELERA